MKHVIQYGVFAAYHLALETSFLADEGASLPELPLNTPITVALPSKPSTIDRSISTIPGFTVPSSEETPWPQSVAGPDGSNSVPSSDLMKETIASINRDINMETSKPPAPMSSQCMKHISSLNEPHLCASEEKKLANLCIASDAMGFEAGRPEPPIDLCITTVRSDCSDMDVSGGFSNPSSFLPDGTSVEEPASKEEFPPSPSDHQSILVSLSSRCVWKGTVCERSHLFRIKYYGNSDKPLGRFLRDHLFDQVIYQSLFVYLYAHVCGCAKYIVEDTDLSLMCPNY